MEKEIRDALNRLVGATGAAHQAALDLQRAMDGEYSQSVPRPAMPLQSRDAGEAAWPQTATGYAGAKRYPIVEGEKAKQCKGCGATIYFATTSSGKFMPVNPDGTSHMDTCPDRDLFRKG